MDSLLVDKWSIAVRYTLFVRAGWKHAQTNRRNMRCIYLVKLLRGKPSDSMQHQAVYTQAIRSLRLRGRATTFSVLLLCL